ncbi:MAG: transposase [Alteromonadaceae bacterium]|nr:MAG: transposase [Alteromonadaceae bacterium]
MGSTFSNLIYHLVFSTKYRAPIITENFASSLYQYIGGIIHSENGVLLQIGGMPDHIHILIRLKPTHTVANITKQIKGGSSLWLNQTHCINEQFAWQEGYGAFSVSQSMTPTLRHYINNQATHHQKYTFDEEMNFLLEKNK